MPKARTYRTEIKKDSWGGWVLHHGFYGGHAEHDTNPRWVIEELEPGGTRQLHPDARNRATRAFAEKLLPRAAEISAGVADAVAKQKAARAPRRWLDTQMPKAVEARLAAKIQPDGSVLITEYDWSRWSFSLPPVGAGRRAVSAGRRAMSHNEFCARYAIMSTSGRIYGRTELINSINRALSGLPGITRARIAAVVDDDKFMRGVSGQVPSAVASDVRAAIMSGRAGRRADYSTLIEAGDHAGLLKALKQERQLRHPIRFKMSYRDRDGKLKWLATHGTYKSVEDAVYLGRGVLDASGDNFLEGAVFRGRQLVQRVQKSAGRRADGATPSRSRPRYITQDGYEFDLAAFRENNLAGTHPEDLANWIAALKRLGVRETIMLGMGEPITRIS